MSHYTDAVQADGLLFISGCVSVDEQWQVVGGDDVVAQARQTFANIGRILEAAGAGFRDVVKVTVYLVDIGDRGAINAVRQEVFGDARPASTLIEVSRLVLPELRLEVDAVALLPEP
jgi:2-iminobutanoate/2-iminopropanoate deaminase